MREVFKEGKRKLGLLTLLLACAFMAGWVRSSYYDDWCFVSLGETFYLLQSEHGGLSCKKWPTPPANGEWFGSRPHIAVLVLSDGQARRYLFFISYSTGTILLTLISAYLLLSHRRLNRPSKNTDVQA